MKLKDIIDEDFQDYKKPSMMLATCFCDWKCLIEKDLDIHICQNSELAHQDNIEVSVDKIIDRYLNNPITQAVVIAGLEPLLQADEVIEFIKKFREKCDADIVLYTGYYPEEIAKYLFILKEYSNIIIKFGRFQVDSKVKYDEVLGVYLSSENQYAIKFT
jgi:pyruvate-formate lyase-activating enzyme